MEEIQALLSHEDEQASQSGTFTDCFSAKNRLRTLIACSVFFLQANSDVSWVLGYMGILYAIGRNEAHNQL